MNLEVHNIEWGEHPLTSAATAMYDGVVAGTADEIDYTIGRVKLSLPSNIWGLAVQASGGAVYCINDGYSSHTQTITMDSNFSGLEWSVGDTIIDDSGVAGEVVSIDTSTNEVVVKLNSSSGFTTSSDFSRSDTSIPESVTAVSETDDPFWSIADGEKEAFDGRNFAGIDMYFYAETGTTLQVRYITR